MLNSLNIYDIQIGFGNEVPNNISLNIYFSGCLNNKLCNRDLCQNSHLHSFLSGDSYTKYIHKIEEILDKNLIDCICYLGGEPLDQNEELLFLFTNIIRKKNPNLKIYLYTGYDYIGNEIKIDHYFSILKITDMYVGHFSKVNKQYWLKNTF